MQEGRPLMRQVKLAAIVTVVLSVAVQPLQDAPDAKPSDTGKSCNFPLLLLLLNSSLLYLYLCENFVRLFGSFSAQRNA